MLSRRKAASLILATPLAACTGAARAPAAYARVEAFVDRLAELEMAPPGFTVSLVTRDGPDFARAWGMRDAASQAPMRTDTPIYIASMTKAFVGLMAVTLERQGVFSLDRTLADYFPSALLPAPLVPAGINFRQLISHRGHLSNEYIQHRTANTDEVPIADYARLLGIGTEYRAEDFRYTNIGYLLYAAALQMETGKSWRDHLDATVAQPIGLAATKARASVYPAGAPARGHQRTREGWFTLSPKTDATMHAAGGMFSTAGDMAAWLRSHLSPRGLPPADFERAHERLADFPPEAYFDTLADGYAYGWMLADYRGLRVLHHGGTYTGFRAQMSFAPALGAGVAVLVPTDHLGGQFAAMVTEAAYDAFRDDPETEARAEARIGAFEADVRKHLSELIARREEVWSYVPREWSPAPSELTPYAGVYWHDGYGRMVVEVVEGQLHARMGLLTLLLTPGLIDNFAGAEALPHAVPERIAFRRGSDGVIDGVQWAEWAFFAREPQGADAR